jgi:hypothetical protein
MFRYPLLFVLGSLFVLSCDDGLDIDLENINAELVVVSNFTEKQEVQVLVSKSSSILLNQEPEYISEATVEIYEGETYLETLEFVEPKGVSSTIPYYSSASFRPEVAVTYVIKVSAPGYEPVMAQSKIPTPIELSGVELESLEYTLLDENQARVSYRLLIRFDDPVDELNYYHVRLVQEYDVFELDGAEKIITGKFREPIKFDRTINSNNVVAHVGGGILLNDVGFNGKTMNYPIPVELFFNPNTEEPGKLFIDLRSVSEEYYLYFDALSRQEEATTTPFNDPVHLFDNIEGGKGIFAGYNSSQDSLKVIN